MTAEPGLADFLLARIAEDEAAVRAIDPVHWSELHYMTPGYTEARALAECEAKRRIVELHPEDLTDEECNGCLSPMPCNTLRALALPYADHPDYRPEWRPDTP